VSALLLGIPLEPPLFCSGASAATPPPPPPARVFSSLGWDWDSAWEGGCGPEKARDVWSAKEVNVVRPKSWSVGPAIPKRLIDISFISKFNYFNFHYVS